MSRQRFSPESSFRCVFPARGRSALFALTFALALCLAIGGASSASAAALSVVGAPPPTQGHGSAFSRILGVRPRALGNLPRVGSVNPAQTLHLSVSLRLPNPYAVSALIAQQQSPRSKLYHHYLTPQGFVDTYAPSAQSVNSVVSFLRNAGFTVTAISSNRLLIDATGTVSQAERAFQVPIVEFRLGKRLVYAPQYDPVVPIALAPIILNVGGLDNVGVAQPRIASAMQNANSSTSKHPPTWAPRVVNPSPNGGFAPSDLRSAYDVATLISNGGNGSSQRVAVYELAPYIASDITTYRTQYGLPSSTINNHSVDGASVTGDASGTIEADLDIEVVSALAPNATQDVYTGPNTTSGLNDTYNAIVTANVDKVTTTSWGLCEPYTGNTELQTLDNIFSQGATQGQSFFAAAGDTGSDDCFDRSTGTPSGYPPSADSPASDPYVMGVGGTSLTLSSGSYSSETEWNFGQGNGGAGGGAISSYFTMPPWQVGAGVSNSFSNGNREVPDVGADADPSTGYATYCTSVNDCYDAALSEAYGWLEVGGTSAATPLWAGIATDINTYLAVNGHATLGWLNQSFYTLFANAQTYAPYHDVTSGNNDIDYASTQYAGDYPSGTCYDLNTGMGSPDAWNIARDVAGGIQTGGGGACPATGGATQLLTDTSFEDNPSHWQQYSADFYTVITSINPHTGANAFFGCGYAGCDDRVWQSVTVPATVNSATFSFWLDSFGAFNSPGTSGLACQDHFYALITTLDGTVVDTAQATCSASTNGYTLESYNVTSVLQAHTGQQLVVLFRATTANETTNPLFFSEWFVDDVSLTVS